jgi:hypothetical protein
VTRPRAAYRRRATELEYFINVAKTGEPAQRTLAYAILIESIRAPRTRAPIREKLAAYNQSKSK